MQNDGRYILITSQYIHSTMNQSAPILSGLCSHIETSMKACRPNSTYLGACHIKMISTSHGASMSKVPKVPQKYAIQRLQQECGIYMHRKKTHSYVHLYYCSFPFISKANMQCNLANYLTPSSLSITFNALSLSISKSITGSLDKILLKDISLLLLDE